MRIRFLKHLRREFEKGMAYLEEMDMPQERGPIDRYFHRLPAAGPSRASSSAAGPSQAPATPPRKSAEEKDAGRQKSLRQLGKMSASSLIVLGDSPVH